MAIHQQASRERPTESLDFSKAAAVTSQLWLSALVLTVIAIPIAILFAFTRSTNPGSRGKFHKVRGNKLPDLWNVPTMRKAKSEKSTRCSADDEEEEDEDEEEDSGDESDSEKGEEDDEEDDDEKADEEDETRFANAEQDSEAEPVKFGVPLKLKGPGS